MKEKLKKALSLYWYFFRIGWYTFGGGWSIVAQIEKDFVDARKEMTAEELLDMVSVGRSLPGLMIGNVTYLFGCRRGGALCGVFAVLVDLAQSSYFAAGTPVLCGILTGALAFVLLMRFKWSIPKVILIGAVLGLLFGSL